jgi:hypothetical protein
MPLRRLAIQTKLWRVYKSYVLYRKIPNIETATETTTARTQTKYHVARISFPCFQFHKKSLMAAPLARECIARKGWCRAKKSPGQPGQET